jgi:hypothetical protein
VDDLPSLARYAGRAWKPKPGGGFAENHEIRLYRPGDKMNQIHWKLSSKMNKLMVREAMEPVQDRVLVEMILRGTPEELDRKFGRLLWTGNYLLEQGLDMLDEMFRQFLTIRLAPAAWQSEAKAVADWMKHDISQGAMAPQA